MNDKVNDKAHQRNIRLVALDSLNDCLRYFAEAKPSRALSLTITKIEEAIMWLEKDMANDAS